MSVMLAQQELMEPGPVRRLIVPDGFSAWWGVDPSTRRLALAMLSPVFDGSIDRNAKTVVFDDLSGARRLSHIYEATRRFVEGIAICCTWPGIVVVEQPGGSARNWPLYYGVGVTIAAIHDGLQEITGRSVAIETTPPATWKKIACGRGDIFKPKAKGEMYGVLRWARENGYTGSSWDEADALGIAEAARRTVALEQVRGVVHPS